MNISSRTLQDTFRNNWCVFQSRYTFTITMLLWAYGMTEGGIGQNPWMESCMSPACKRILQTWLANAFHRAEPEACHFPIKKSEISPPYRSLKKISINGKCWKHTPRPSLLRSAWYRPSWSMGAYTLCRHPIISLWMRLIDECQLLSSWMKELGNLCRTQILILLMTDALGLLITYTPLFQGPWNRRSMYEDNLLLSTKPNHFCIAHGCFSRYTRSESSVAFWSLRGAPLGRKWGLNGETQMKGFSRILYTAAR